MLSFTRSLASRRFIQPAVLPRALVLHAATKFSARTVISIPMPEGKPDLTHAMLPPTKLFFENRHGIGLHVRSWLPERAEDVRGTIFYVHSYGSHVNSVHHSAKMEHFRSKGYAVFAFDIEGHGYSSGERALVHSFRDIIDDAVRFVNLVMCLAHRARGKYSVRGRVGQYNLGADDEILDAVRRSRYYVFGESMGGLIGLLLSKELHAGEADVPNEFGGAVLIAPALAVSHLPPAPVLFLMRKVIARMWPSEPMPAYVSRSSRIRTRDCFLSEDRIKESLLDRWGETQGGLSWGHAMKWGTAGAFATAYSTLHQNMKEIRFPFLVFHDPADNVTAIEGSRQLMELSPSLEKRLVEVPGALHDPLFNDPSAVAPHVLSFLEARA